MDKPTQIRDLLRSIAGTDKPLFSFRLMEVVGVDGDLCRAKMDDFEIPDIRLSSIDGGSENGLLVVPAKGSIILVADISCGNLRELCAIGYSEIESIRFHQGKTTITADADGATVEVGNSKMHVEDGKITFNDGANHGLVKVEELKRTLESIKTYCETLTQAVSTGLAGVGAGAAANGGTGASKFGEAMAAASIRLEELENDKVTH